MPPQPNPLLEAHELPPFQAIRPEHILPAVEAALANNRLALEQLLQQKSNWDW